jgi:hypothetical protein
MRPTTMAQLVRLTYVSQAAAPLSEPALQRIVERARQHNRANGLTGALLDYGGRFLQVLEGPADAVHATFRRIAADPRHRRIVTVEYVGVPARQFSHWAMRHVATGHANDRVVAQFLDELAHGPDATRARHAVTLLQRLADAPVAVPA